MLNKIKKKLRIDSLGWRLSCFMAVILIIILILISLLVYRNSSTIVTRQVNDSIDLIVDFQGDRVNNLLAELDRQLGLIATDDQIGSYLDVVERDSSRLESAREEGDKEEEEAAMQGLNDFVNGTINYQGGGKLHELLDDLRFSEFGYIVLPTGETIVDSRIRSYEDQEHTDDYLLQNLEKELYSDIEFGQIYDLEEESYLLHQVPIYDEEEEDVRAYLVVAFSPQLVFEELTDPSGEQPGTYTLVNGDMQIIRGQEKDNFGQEIENEWFRDNLRQNENRFSEIVDNNYQMISRVSDNLLLTVEIPQGPMYSDVRNLSSTILVIALVTLVVGVVLVYFFMNRQLKPLEVFYNSFSQMKEGNLSSEVKLAEKYTGRRDELGRMASAFNNMIDDIRDLVTGIISKSKQLDENSQIMHETSQEAVSLTEQINASMQEVSSGSQQQLAEIEQISDNISALNGQLEGVEDNAREISEGADNVIERIGRGNEAVEDSLSKIKNVDSETQKISRLINELGSMSREIGNIVDLISDISEQTNLLALNAAIEAARAGEAGRGFSIVAEEIRGLAEQSSDAAENISELIQNIQSRVKKAVQAMNENRELVSESVSTIKETDSVFGNIEDVSRELRKAIRIIVDNLRQMSSESEKVEGSIREISVISEEFAASSEEIASSGNKQVDSIEEIEDIAKKLEKMSEELNEVVNSFKTEQE
ncbi:MAG: methyl-accepting chemotaxis protein [Halanaerobiaceae bacterium]